METLGIMADKLNIGLLNAWWYPVAFGIVNLISMIAHPKQFRQRVFAIPGMESRLLKITFFVSMVLFSRGLILYSVFVPLVLNTPWFWTGTTIFVIGLGFLRDSATQFRINPQQQAGYQWGLSPDTTPDADNVHCHVDRGRDRFGKPDNCRKQHRSRIALELLIHRAKKLKHRGKTPCSVYSGA